MSRRRFGRCWDFLSNETSEILYNYNGAPRYSRGAPHGWEVLLNVSHGVRSAGRLRVAVQAGSVPPHFPLPGGHTQGMPVLPTERQSITPRRDFAGRLCAREPLHSIDFGGLHVPQTRRRRRVPRPLPP